MKPARAAAVDARAPEKATLAESHRKRRDSAAKDERISPPAVARRPSAAPVRANHLGAGPVPATRTTVVSAPAIPVPASLRTRLAAVVGTRAVEAAHLHADAAASARAREHNARALTEGEDVYFGEGQYRPGTTDGDALIAHEIAHVDQAQRGLLKGPARKALGAAVQSPLETAADEAADQLSPGADLDEQQKARRGRGKRPHLALVPQGAGETPAAEAPAEAAAAPQGLTPATGQEPDVAPTEAAATSAEPAPAAVARVAGVPPGLPLMPEPPVTLSKTEKGRAGGVQARATSTAVATATAPAPSQNVSVAKAAVLVPQTENDARAAEKLVAELATKEKPSPEIVALCDRIHTLITDKRPADEDGVIDTRPQEVAQAAGSTVEGGVQKNVDGAKSAYGAIEGTPTGPQSPAPPGIEPLTTAVAAPEVNATAATPDAVPPEQVNLDGDSTQMDAKAREAGLESEPAQLVQGGPVGEARDARGEMKHLSKDGPAEALRQQKAALAQSDTDMAALQARALASLKEARTGHVGGVKTQQGEFKGGEEALRARLSEQAKDVFTGAQTRVQDILRDVPATAMKKWSTELPFISKQFNDDLKVVKDKIEDRHSGVSGWFVSGWDAVSGLPGWVKKAYDAAEKNFGDRVCALITNISIYVNGIIKIADDIIAKARTDISDIFTKDLPEGLKAWGADQETSFGKKLDGLHNQAEATRTSFNKELIENAGGAAQSARESIQKLRQEAKGLWGRFLDAVGKFLDDPVRFIINGLLSLVGISPPAFWGVVAKIQKFVGEIADAPLRFANNLMAGISRGFSLFFGNIARHLIEGFLEWLLSGMANEGIALEIPKELSLRSVVGFFLQLLGISWSRIRKLLVEQLGEKAVAIIEKAGGAIYALATKGIAGIWEDIKKLLEPKTIIDAIIDAAIKYLAETLIVKVSARIIAMLNPAGAILAALEAIYRVLKWVFTNAAKIFHLIEAVVNGMVDVLAGNIAGVAKMVEGALAKLTSPVIDFLADYIGLGGLPGKVANAVKGLQAWVEGVLRSVIKWLVDVGRKMLAAMGIGGKGEKDKKDAGGQIGETLSFTKGEETHRLYITVAGKNATVMVSSTPMTASVWLDLLEKDIRSAGSEEQPEGARKLITTARQLIAKTDAEADAAAAQKAASAEGVAQTAAKGAVVISDEEALGAVLQQLGTLFGKKVPPIIKSLYEPDPLDLDAIGTPLGVSIEASTGNQTIHTSSSSPAELVEKLLKNNPDAYNPKNGQLTLPELGTSAFKSAASLSELGTAIGARASVSQVTFARTEKGGNIKLGTSPSTIGGSVTTVMEDRPKVGTYAKLEGIKDYTPHHVPPKGLANWIYQQIITIPPKISSLKVVRPIVLAAVNAKREHDGGGRKLSCILIHAKTHISKTGEPANDDYRVHHGKTTSELVGERLRAKGIKPIIKGEELLEDPSDIAQAMVDQAEGGANEVAVGKPSTQFYLKELNAARAEVEVKVEEDVDAFFGSVQNVFGRAWSQSREAVSVGLEHSGGRDGFPDTKKAAVAELGPLAVSTWRAISDPDILPLIALD